MNTKSKGVAVLISIFMIVLAILLWHGMSILLSSDVKQVDASEKHTLAIVLKALDSHHWKSMKKGAEDAAKELDINLIVLAPDKESNVEMQFQMIEDLIDNKVEAIGVAPCDSEKVVPLIHKALSQDIMVVTLDTNANSDVPTFIGTDNYLAGKMAGERMVELLGNEGELGLITGMIKQQTHKERVKGFRDAIATSNIQIQWMREANSSSEMAHDVMERMLIDSEANAIEGVFVTNALMTLGVLEAVKNHDKAIRIIGVDLQMELFNGIETGEIDSMIAQNPYGMGYRAVHTMVDGVRGMDVPIRIDTGTEMITKDNVGTYKQEYENY